MKKIVVICGPTASGKTKLAIELAQKYNGEIISADSGQVWRELDLGTAKPTFEERRRVPHHLIDVVTPGEHFDVSQYCALADKAIDDIIGRGKVPFVVGGTGMYLRVLFRGLCEAPPQDLQIRKELEARIQTEGLNRLHEELQNRDPPLAKKLNPKDTTRIVRGLEVYEITGIPLSTFQEKHQFQNPRYEVLQIGLCCDKKVLHERIEKRTDWMLYNGWVEEVRELLKFYSTGSQAFRTLGYKTIATHLKGELSLSEATAEIKKQTKAFAKRQGTWFRSDPSIFWVRGEESLKNIFDAAVSAVDHFLCLCQ